MDDLVLLLLIAVKGLEGWTMQRNPWISMKTPKFIYLSLQDNIIIATLISDCKMMKVRNSSPSKLATM
jgi:hypothetical protein